MRDPEEVLRRAAADLQALGLDWAVVGALAVGARSEPRFTRHVDVAVAVDDDAAAEATVRELRDLGYRILATVEHERTGRLATVRFIPPDSHADDPTLDVVFATSGIEGELVADAEEVEVFPDQHVPIARTGHLIALKLLSESEERPLDRQDLKSLLEMADQGELQRAREGIALIAERGFNRTRDLEAKLAEYLHRFGQR